VNVELLIEDVAGRAEFGVVAPASSELALSATAVLLILVVVVVVTVAPFKLFIRAEALLRGVLMRFLGGLASSADVPHEPGLTSDPRPDAVLMLFGADAVKVVAPDPVSVVMDAPCDCELLVLVVFARVAEAAGGSSKKAVESEEGDVTVLVGLASFELISWRMSGLLHRPCCCCCSSVVVPTGAGSVFPK